jgi:hypothetical protein
VCPCVRERERENERESSQRKREIVCVYDIYQERASDARPKQPS